MGLYAGPKVPTVYHPTRCSPHDAPPYTLEKRNLELLQDPERAFVAGYGMHLSEQLGPAGIVPVKRKHNYSEERARSEPKQDQSSNKCGPGNQGVEHLGKPPNQHLESLVGPRLSDKCS